MKRHVSVLCLTGALAGCGSHIPITKGNDSGSSVTALVNSSAFNKAFQIVDSLNYVPFSYTRDGCYARAYYMAMELASQSIPSSNQFVFARSGRRPLQLEDGTAWRYHVAPLLQVGSAGKPMILDPSLAPRPLEREEWFRKMVRSAVDTVLVPGSVHVNQVTGSYPSGYEKLITRFSEMPPFSLGYIRLSCSTLSNMLSNVESGGLAAKRQKLVARTSQLIESLYQLNKLDVRTSSQRMTNVAFLCGKFRVSAQLNPSARPR